MTIFLERLGNQMFRIFAPEGAHLKEHVLDGGMNLSEYAKQVLADPNSSDRLQEQAIDLQVILGEKTRVPLDET